jgi:hypothetical protein|tara:strand:- start:1925 stop:2152 length:228 start_codon:yes stop_codon:yes gene_type:complete
MIHVKYLGPTNTKGSRIKLTDKWFGQSKTISYDYRFSSSMEGATSFLIKNGWTVLGRNGEDMIILVKEWNKRLKE